MKLSARFSEYGLVGAFFLIGLFLVIATATPTEFNQKFWGWVNKNIITSLMQNFLLIRSTTEKDIVFSEAFSATLGVVAIFVTGLLLDLISTLFFIFAEMLVFSRMLHWYKSDFDRIKILFPLSARQDYDMFLSNFGVRILMSPHLAIARIRLISCYSRNFAFLITYAGSGEVELDALGDHLRVWRTVRGISASAIALVYCWLAMHEDGLYGLTGAIIVWAISMYIVGINFGRLSASLLSSVCVVAGKIDLANAKT